MTIRIDGTNTAANPGITGTDTDTGLQFGTDEVNIVTGGSTRATIDSSGVVRIGGTDAYNGSDKLTLVNNSGNCSLTIDSTSSGESSVFFADGATGNEAYRGYLQYQHSSDALLVGAAGQERMRILSGGGLTFNGDTAAANALDDYEEGTWTPVFKYYASGAWNTVSFASGPSNTTGSYVKIGNVVHFSYYAGAFELNSSADGNSARIEGLPYTAYNSHGSYSGALFYHTTGFQQTILSGYIETGQNRIYPTLSGSTSLATWSASATRYLMVSGTYRTT